MLTEQEIEDTSEEWFTGRLKDGTRSPRVGWFLDKKTGSVSRKPPDVSMLAAMLASLGDAHMVRVDVTDSGSVRIEIEDRDSSSRTKGDGAHRVFEWRQESESMHHVRCRGLTIGERLGASVEVAAKLAREAEIRAAYTAEQLVAAQELTKREAELSAAQEAYRVAEKNLTQLTAERLESATTVTAEGIRRGD